MRQQVILNYSWRQLAVTFQVTVKFARQLFANNCDHLRPFATICDHVRPFATNCDHLRPLAIICDHLRHLGHLRQFETTCDQLRPFATFATICDHLPAFTTNCDHFFTICDQLQHLRQFATNCDLLQPFLTICDQLRPFATMRDHLWLFATFATICNHFLTIYDQLRPFVTICDHLQHLRHSGHLRPFALQCDCHWAYKIRIYHYSSLGLFSKFRTDLGPTCHLDDGSLCHNIFAIIMPMSWYCFKISRYCIIGLNINTWYNVMICHYKGMMWHVGLIT